MAFLDWLSSAAQSRSLKTRIQNDPYYRFQSLEEIRIAASIGIQIDVNQANVDDWLRLPGLSIHQARMLVQLGELGVQFLCIEDIAAALGMSLQRLKPLEPILKFCYYDPESIEQIQRVNLNTASIEDLGRISIIKPVLARAIVQNRIKQGKYQNLLDLQQRLSLPSELTSEIMHYLIF
jgi:DNA uptake protein ComE-like DNA-binding protein